MKKIFFILSLFIWFFTACSTKSNSFLGTYSFKLSGEVTFTQDEALISHNLVSKTGQLTILKDHTTKDAKHVLLVLNEMNGSGYTIHGTIHDNRITLEPYDFSTHILHKESTSILDDNNGSLVCQIHASGNGFFNDSVLIIEEQWTGHPSDDPTTTLNASKITLLAKKN